MVVRYVVSYSVSDVNLACANLRDIFDYVEIDAKITDVNIVDIITEEVEKKYPYPKYLLTCFDQYDGDDTRPFEMRKGGHIITYL